MSGLKQLAADLQIEKYQKDPNFVLSEQNNYQYQN